MPKRSTIKALGITFITFFLACAIVCAVLTGIDYRFANPDWKQFPWEPLSPLQVASIVYAFILGLFGYYVFTHPRRALIVCYEIFLALSFLFTLAIGIFAIIAGSTDYLNVQLGCQAYIDGIMNSWTGIDNYIQRVDQALCSDECPCAVQNSLPFTSNATIAPIYHTWNVTDVSYGATSFQNCSGNVRLNVYNDVARTDPAFDPTKEFKDTKFFEYMARVEEKFHCTGWCQTRYMNQNLNREVTISKYLFSNINRGPPQNMGCLYPILQWLPPYLLAFGSVAFVLAGCQLIVLILTKLLARSKKHEDLRPEELQGVHHDRDLIVNNRS